MKVRWRKWREKLKWICTSNGWKAMWLRAVQIKIDTLQDWKSILRHQLMSMMKKLTLQQEKLDRGRMNRDKNFLNSITNIPLIDLIFSA